MNIDTSENRPESQKPDYLDGYLFNVYREWGISQEVAIIVEYPRS